MHLDFPPKIITIISRPIKFKNYYSKMQIGEKGGSGLLFLKKGVFSQKMRILVALRGFYIIILDELWKVHCGVLDREILKQVLNTNF